MLAKDFRVLSFAIDPKAGAADAVRDLGAALGERNITEAGIIADAAAASTAIAFAVAQAGTGAVRGAAVAIRLRWRRLQSEGAGDGHVWHLRHDARLPTLPRHSASRFRTVVWYMYSDADRAVDDERPEAVSAALQDFRNSARGLSGERKTRESLSLIELLTTAEMAEADRRTIAAGTPELT